MRASLLSIGAELLHGFLTDTNATFLTQELTALGIDTVGVMQVGDNLEHIARAFRRALADSELVVATGGIGPTDDDLTREAIAAVVGEEPRVDPQLVEVVRAFFAARGIEMPAQNAKQAWIIPSSETLPNPMGTAPGWFVRFGGNVLICMPGVPREMRRMWTEQAVPRIVPLLGSGGHIVSRTLKTIGIGESAAEQEVIDLVRLGRPAIATYAKDDGVHIRVSMTADDRYAAEHMVADADRAIRARIGQYVYGYLGDSLADVILRPLAATTDKLAIWEAGTAARFANLLLDDSLADVVVAGRCTTYAAATAVLGVEDGPAAVARACARAVARECSARFGAAITVAIDDAEGADRAVGRVALALVHPDGVVTREHQVTAIPSEIRRRATLWACEFLWNALRDATAARPV